jgi:hypothetical protein
VLAYASVLEITECDRPLVGIVCNAQKMVYHTLLVSGYINFCPDGITTTDVSTADHQTQLSTGIVLVQLAMAHVLVHR